MALLAIIFGVLTYLALSPLSALMLAPTAGLLSYARSFGDGTRSKPTLLGVPQELRNKIVSAKLTCHGTHLTLVSSATFTTQAARSQSPSTWISLQSDANAYREPAN